MSIGSCELGVGVHGSHVVVGGSFCEMEPDAGVDMTYSCSSS